jgi:hypothetical protein
MMKTEQDILVQKGGGGKGEGEGERQSKCVCYAGITANRLEPRRIFYKKG